MVVIKLKTTMGTPHRRALSGRVRRGTRVASRFGFHAFFHRFLHGRDDRFVDLVETLADALLERHDHFRHTTLVLADLSADLAGDLSADRFRGDSDSRHHFAELLFERLFQVK